LNILTQQFQNKQIRILVIDGIEWFIAKDIATLLGYKETAKAIRTHCKKVLPFSSFKRGNELFSLDPQTRLIPESDVSMLIQKSRTVTETFKSDLINFLNLKDKFVFSSKEIEFFSALQTVLKPMNIELETQFNVLDYRIDGYIKEFNLAIEYDENHHNSKTNKMNDSIREKKIKNYLKCNFIRVKENESNYHNIGIVIDRIFKKKFTKKHRQEEIINLLKTESFTTKELAQKFNVSRSTILRDLKSIDKLQKIRKGIKIFYKL